MNYTLTEGKFKSFDGLNLHYRHYQKPGARDTLVFLHGHGEHSGRYQKFSEQLIDKNLSLAFYDMRGCGLSEGEHCYVNRYEDYIRDFSSFIQFLTDRHNLAADFFIFGHSNGGLVAIPWALENLKKVKAIFLSSPFLGLKLPTPLILLNQFLSAVNPHFVYKNPVYPPYLTHNPAEVDYYKRDLLIHRKITSGLLSEMMRYHRKLEEISVFEFSFPISILMSGLDRVVDPSKTQLFYEKIRAPYKNLKVFEGFYHEIFNELGQDQVFEALRSEMTAVARYFPA